jgi:hypothetical protein
MSKNAAMLALMTEDAKTPASPDKLDKLRAAVRTLRDKEQQRVDLMARHAELGVEIYEIKTKTIVDLFDDAKVDNIGIPPEGNNPGVVVEVGWHYKANIGSPSEPKVEDYAESIKYIKSLDPDLLKTTFSIEFGLNEGKAMKAFETSLKKAKLSYSTSFGVPWNTLTAWLRDQIENRKRKNLKLKLLGATVERTAKFVKPRASKADKSTPKTATKRK